MPTDPIDRTAPPHLLKAWAEDYQRDPPLYTHFPLTLSNGARPPSVACVCGGCGNIVDRELVRGRVYWSLPTVVTVEATGHCRPCSRITRIHCRFRVVGDSYIVEWLDKGEQWRRGVVRAPSVWDRFARWVRMKLAR
jgi:hypothetical protein